ncbi:hypothetical protein [Arthrobacter sp. efr-133-TYG-118]|uniref:hypothetical protein n=1 Tax=Arthrobacter sp. efr-133-TYG-118 TaxID=3040279 RepID=UPI00254C2101|nr:hypothetical protein [Arthrobacter sp. efr-133-TYG-118]
MTDFVSTKLVNQRPGQEPSSPFGANHQPLTVQIVTADTCCRLKTLRWVPEKLFAESREMPQPNAVHDWRRGAASLRDYRAAEIDE